MSLGRNQGHLLKILEGLRDEMLDFTLRLVAQESTLGKEKGALDLMEGQLRRIGYDPVQVPIDRDSLSAHSGYAPVPWDFENRYNIVAVRSPNADGGRSLVLNGHLDVVHPGVLDQWDSDPFQPKVKEGRIYGRGAGDMKAGVAAMTYALSAIDRAGFGLKAPVTIEAVIEEECSGNGALACVNAGFTGEAVLIPEPFGPTILTHQLGVVWFKISVQGAAKHVLEAGAGINAIEKCFSLISALRGLESELNSEKRPQAYLAIGHPIHLNIGLISGGHWPSSVPSTAEFHCRLAYFPGTSFQMICDRITHTVNAAARSDPWLSEWPPVIEYYGFRSDGHSVSRDLPALKMLNDCHRAITGTDAAEYVATCTTDLRAFHFFGNAQATCYGPEATNIHGANESVSIESLVHVARIYALFISQWCGLTE
jgi:acetylornithine deacetylase